MTVLANADEGDVDGRFADRLIRPGDDLSRIPFSIQEVSICDSSLADQVLLQKAAETGGMRHGQSDVLVEMKEFHPVPVEALGAGKRVEKLELRRRAGRNDAG